MNELSPARADEVLDALRRGTVPESSLDAFAVGLDPYRDTLISELDQCALGRGRFKALRGEYGTAHDLRYVQSGRPWHDHQRCAGH